jgi:hypothetical protein
LEFMPAPVQWPEMPWAASAARLLDDAVATRNGFSEKTAIARTGETPS